MLKVGGQATMIQKPFAGAGRGGKKGGKKKEEEKKKGSAETV